MKFRKYLLAAAVVTVMSMASGCRNNHAGNGTNTTKGTINHTTESSTKHTTDGTTSHTTDGTTSHTTDGTGSSVHNETRVDGTTTDSTRHNTVESTTDVYHETARATEGLLDEMVDDIEGHTEKDNVTSTDHTTR